MAFLSLIDFWPMLNSVPLFTSLLGLLLLMVVFANKAALSNNQPARITLIVIILLVIHAQLDAYLYYNGNNYAWVGLSFLHYPFMGGLFLFFTSQLAKLSINLRPWLVALVMYSVLRILFLIPEDSAAYENYSNEIGWTDLGIAFDNFVSNALNIAGLFMAFIKLKRMDFVVKPSDSDLLNIRLLRGLLVFQIGLYVSLVLITLISFFFAEHWLLLWKVETMITGIFFFVLAFYAIRFPIFSVSGDFRDLPEADEKYAKSSLSEKESVDIWQQINSLMDEEELYLNPEFRLNDLAEKTGRSVHHVSQAINQQDGASFSDFLNGYRIDKSRKLLQSDKAKQYTILAIAYESGFNSKTAFYNAFKKHTGTTPSKFLKG